jgi:hypothetical protein
MGPWDSVPATPAQRAARQGHLSSCDANQAYCASSRLTATAVADRSRNDRRPLKPLAMEAEGVALEKSNGVVSLGRPWPVVG